MYKYKLYHNNNNDRRLFGWLTTKNKVEDIPEDKLINKFFKDNIDRDSIELKWIGEDNWILEYITTNSEKFKDYMDIESIEFIKTDLSYNFKPINPRDKVEFKIL